MSAFLTVIVFHFVCLVSPGPDFVMVTRNSLVGSHRAGILTALGIALGMSVHIAYSILGIGFVIAQSIMLFNLIKFAGAAYLIYIGAKALFSRRAAEKTDQPTAPTSRLTDLQTFRMGFVCNVLNPKATLFFLALFTQVIAPGTPLAVQLIYGAVMMSTTFLWFALVASVLSLPFIKKPFERIMSGLERVTGAVLIALGVKLALASRE